MEIFPPSATKNISDMKATFTNKMNSKFISKLRDGYRQYHGIRLKTEKEVDLETYELITPNKIVSVNELVAKPTDEAAKYKELYEASQKELQAMKDEAEKYKALYESLLNPIKKTKIRVKPIKTKIANVIKLEQIVEPVVEPVAVVEPIVEPALSERNPVVESDDEFDFGTISGVDAHFEKKQVDSECNYDSDLSDDSCLMVN
jgi:hypothetical protein